MRRSIVGRFYQHNPRVAVIVTASWGDKENAMACTWHSAISFEPPLYGIAISPKRFTYKLIMESKQFGVNFIPWEKARLVAAVGGTTGYEIDKFKAFGIEKAKPIKLQLPILKDAYSAYECQVVGHHTYGDHEWIVGEIVAVHLLPGAFTEKDEIIELGLISPLLYLGKDFYATVDRESISYFERGRL